MVRLADLGAAQADPALRRPAPARRARPRAGQPAARAAARRAAGRARPQAAPGDAARAQAHPARAARAITFIYVTHDQDEALTMSDRIAVFSDGRIEQVGTPARGLRAARPTSSSPASSARRTCSSATAAASPCARRRSASCGTAAARRGCSRAGHASREVVYLGSVTRYVVDLDDGGTLVAAAPEPRDAPPARRWRQRGRRRAAGLGARARSHRDRAAHEEEQK